MRGHRGHFLNSVWTSRRVIATRASAHPSDNPILATYTSTTGWTFRFPMTCRQAGSDLNIVYANYFAAGETDGRTNYQTQSIFVRCVLEMPGGSLQALTCNGQSEVEIPANQTIRFSAPGVSLNDNDSFAVRTFVRVANVSHTIPATQGGSSTVGNGMWRIAGDETMTSGTPAGVTWTNQRTYGPVAVTAETYDTSAPSVGFIGDSIVAGQADSYSGYTGSETNNVGPGSFKRAFDTAGISYTSLAVPGSKTAHIISQAQGKARLNLVPSCTTIAFQMGSNDLTDGVTSTQLIQNYEKIFTWLRLRGVKKIIVHTILPRALSSIDSYTTTTGQTTVTWEAQRLAMNAAIRAGTIAGVDDYVELANVVESAENSGKWAVNGTNNWMTADGSHPSPTAYSLMADAITSNISKYL